MDTNAYLKRPAHAASSQNVFHSHSIVAGGLLEMS